MKKLILKWLGLTDLKGRVEYCEALSKDNQKELRELNLNLITIAKEVKENLTSIIDLQNDVEAQGGRLLNLATSFGKLKTSIPDYQDQINTLCMEVDELKAEIAKLKPKTIKTTTRAKPIVKTHDKSPKKSTKK
jgi:chromosome segregation ATPase